MFTGIIEGLGTIADMKPSGQGRKLTIDADFVLDQTKPGDSIAVNGACLTAVKIQGKHRFTVDVSPETIVQTCFSYAKPGDRVNLERALLLSSRIDGHLVSGHIDGMGTIKNKNIQSNAIIITFGISQKTAGYMIHKGSVAVDGVSLTINRCDLNSFDVSIIPHTAKLTTIGFKKIGESVNIETDMIGKYVEKFVTGKKDVPGKESVSGLDKNFLMKNGFI
ncbi:Riboflavin synthase [Desulfonema limicola]|uniref:Riboflavin synthase n=1 Tax=Desulfonema limicola TaxID=45656 RepID=A0A975GFQ8_9BACT|nr:riboflavin synthase [Desulfonema limicola]QTA79498.1 Riboflavin synthase [Desulfonema limicola]